MNYRYVEKQKTLALGVYPEVSLAKARNRREVALALMAGGIDPSQVKQDDRKTKVMAEAHNFEFVTRKWLAKTASDRATSTQKKVTNWLNHDVFQFIRTRPISAIDPRDVLMSVQKMEDRGAVDSAHRVKQICGQVFRNAVGSGFAERNVMADFKAALTTPEKVITPQSRSQSRFGPCCAQFTATAANRCLRCFEAFSAGIRANGRVTFC